MKEGFTFNYASLKFLRKVIFKNFGGGGGGQKRTKTHEFYVHGKFRIYDTK